MGEDVADTEEKEKKEEIQETPLLMDDLLESSIIDDGAKEQRETILRTLLESYLSREATYDALMRSHNERLLGMWRGYKQSVDSATQRQQTLALRSPTRQPNVIPDSRRYRGYGIDL